MSYYIWVISEDRIRAPSEPMLLSRRFSDKEWRYFNCVKACDKDSIPSRQIMLWARFRSRVWS